MIVSWPRIMEVFTCEYVTRTIVVDKLMYMDGKDRSAFYSYSETGFFVCKICSYVDKQ